MLFPMEQLYLAMQHHKQPPSSSKFTMTNTGETAAMAQVRRFYIFFHRLFCFTPLLDDDYNTSTQQQQPTPNAGDGSTLENTKRTRLIVELLVTRYNINGMLDAPCGAMLWMPYAIERVREYNPNFKYCGVDVVPTVIESNAQRFKKLKHYRFEVVDVAAQEMPEGYDLIWSRDALQHLSYDLIVPALDNFAHSGAKYLAVGSYKVGDNRNIETGAYFAIDLRQSPFNLDSPMDIMDEETSDGKLVLIYDVKYLKKQDFTKMRQRAGLPKL